MPFDIQSYHTLVTQSDEELYQELGAALSPSHAFPPSPDRLVQIGRTWLDKKREALAGSLCKDPKLRALAATDPKTQENAALVAALADLVATAVAGVPAMTVAVLLVRRGLQELCANSWS